MRNILLLTTLVAIHLDATSYTQIILYNLARWHAGLQAMERLIQTHLSPSHKNKLSYHAFGSEQVLRFSQKISQECGVAEIEELMLLRLGRINLAIEVFREPNQGTTGGRQ